MFRRIHIVPFVAVFVLCAIPSFANVYYVATNDPTASDGNTGTEAQPWKTIGKANTTLQAGDTVYVKAGTYTARISPSYSGSDGSPISYVRYGQDQVTLTGNYEPGVWINGKSYIIVDGFISDYQNKHVWIQAGSHNIIRNCDLKNVYSSGGAMSGILIESGSTYNQILNNTIEHSGTSTGGDSLVIRTASNYNLVANNSILEGGHSDWAIRSGSYNVLRDNYFINPLQKIGEVYDDSSNLTVPTQHNVIQDNVFDRNAAVVNLAPYSAIQFAGQRTIVRRNRFYDSAQESLQLANYSTEALRCMGNRIYNNVFSNNAESGIFISASTTGEGFGDNVFKNNILHNNYYIQHDSRFDWLANLNNQNIQLNVGRLNGYVFVRNNIYTSHDAGDWLIVAGWRSALLTPPNHNVAWFDTNYPSLFQNDMQVEPQFVDAPNHNFHLAAGSPMIDAGTYLTQVVGSGTSSTITVADATYFYDGFGIAGEHGDWVQLAGTTQTAQITNVNYSTNVLTLDRALTFTNGQGIGLTYSGSAPDLGAFEYTAVTASIVGRRVFYNNSAFDGNDAAANASDDNSIAPDKTPLLPGGTATFANYTSYSRGINGVMIDVMNLAGTPTAADFECKVGNDNTPSGWSVAPAPSVSVRPGAGVGGSARISLTWSDGAIQKQWLRVKVLATANTGLPTSDVFYFGNAIGETGNSFVDAVVGPTDEVAVRSGTHTMAVNPAAIDDTCDFNRDQKVGPTDEVICHNNGTVMLNALKLITPLE